MGSHHNGQPPRLNAVRQLDVDFQRRDVFAAIHPDDDLFRIELDMPRDHCEDFFAQDIQEIRLATQATFMREKRSATVPVQPAQTPNGR